MKAGVGVGTGIALIVASIASSYIWKGEGQSSAPPLAPPQFAEHALPQIALVGKPRLPLPNAVGGPATGGGCTTFCVLSLEVTPTIIRPKTTVTVGDSFLVGLRLEVTSASALRRVCAKTEDKSKLLKCVNTDKVALAAFTNEELSLVRDASFKASLVVPGDGYAPKGSVSVRIGPPVFWSIQASTAGVVSGWVQIERGFTGLGGVAPTEAQRTEIDLNLLGEGSGQTFSATIQQPRPTFWYLLSVVGSILGTLLASMPAWLAWHEKRKSQKAEAVKPRIVIP
jgi:hypothetical protein